MTAYIISCDKINTKEITSSVLSGVLTGVIGSYIWYWENEGIMPPCFLKEYNDTK